MSYWDTSALVKIFVSERDSFRYLGFLSASSPIVTSAIVRYELRAAFRRKEAEGSLRQGGAAALLCNVDQDIERGKMVLHALDAEVEDEFAGILERCYASSPPMFIRTNDALHLASAIIAGESTFISADARQRAAALLLGFVVLPD